MKDCWQVSPNDRPTFLQVRKDLDDMLADNEVIIYLRYARDHFEYWTVANYYIRDKVVKIKSRKFLLMEIYRSHSRHLIGVLIKWRCVKEHICIEPIFIFVA